jgi:putative flippase GtrA
MDSVDQPTAAPTRKVATGGLGAAVVTIIIWLVQTFTDVEVTPEIAAALAGAIGWILAYLVPERA